MSKKRPTKKEMTEKIIQNLSHAFHETHKITRSKRGDFFWVDRGDGRLMQVGVFLPVDKRSDLEKLADVKKEQGT